MSLLPAFCTLALVLLPTLAYAEDLDVTSPKTLSNELAVRSFETKIGDWKLIPSLSAGLGWSDNIESEPVGKDDGLITSRGRLELRGKIDETQTRLVGQTYVFKPFSTPTENDYRSDVSLELRRDFSPAARGRVEFVASEMRPGFSTSSLDRQTILAIKPLVTFEKDQYQLSLRGAFGSRDFSAVGDDGAMANTDQRSHNFGKLEIVGSREIAEKMNAYVGAMVRDSIYDRQIDDRGYHRGSLGAGVFAGLRGEVGDKLLTDLAVGYVRQEFDDSRYSSVDYLSVNGFVQLRATDKLRLTLQNETDFEEDLDYGASGALNRELTLRTEYQFTEKLVAVAEAEYERKTFLQAGIQENATTLAVGFDYAVAKNLIFMTRSTIESQKSDDPLETYRRKGLYAWLSFN